MKEEIISLREFARRLDVGEKTIRDGIKLGKISKGVTVVNGKPKINYNIALKEAQDIGLGNKSLISKGIDPSEKSKQEPKYIHKQAQTNTESNSNDEPEPIAGLGPDASLVTASRAEKIFKAQLACMMVDEKAGTLVSKSEVYSQLFEFGSQIRSEFESMPGRISSKLATFTDQSQIAEYLAKEIRLSLSKLIDDLGERKIG